MPQQIGRSRAAAVAVLLVAATLLPLAPASAVSESQYDQCLLDSVNQDRQSLGLAPLVLGIDLISQVRDYSQKMSVAGFEHMSSAEREAILPDSWTSWRENIAWSSMSNPGDCSRIHKMLMESPGHRENILASDVAFMVPGTYIGSSGVWVTELFFSATNYFPYQSGLFWDDDNTVYEAHVEWLVNSGIAAGCGNGKFCPYAPVTREQMAVFLANALHLAPSSNSPFSDTASSPFRAQIAAIAEAGITSGCGVGKYCPTQVVTREEMAGFLHKAFNLAPAARSPFVDTADSVFEDPISRIAQAGITAGCDVNMYCPNAPVSRGQMAAFLHRALG